MIVSCFTTTYTWWDTGHMLVAKIAELELKSKNPEAIQLAENITAVMNPFSHGKINSFVESASYPDDVKQYKLNMMDTWHYLDVPVRANDTSDPHTHVPHTTSDSAALMTGAMKALLHWNKWESKNLANETMEKSLMLRYLVHVVGDVHQPLHSAEFFDDQLFPKGDMGGNLFLINYTGIKNLHSFYDSGADSLNNNITRPLNNSSRAVLEEIAVNLMKEFPKRADFLTVNGSYPFDDWIVESTIHARDFVYKNLTYKANITESYKTQAALICRKRISEAGFRLAQLVQDIYAAYKKKLEEPEKAQPTKFLS